MTYTQRRNLECNPRNLNSKYLLERKTLMLLYGRIRKDWVLKELEYLEPSDFAEGSSPLLHRNYSIGVCAPAVEAEQRYNGERD